MNKIIAYLKTTSFRNTILLAISTVIGVALILFFSLSFYTHHGTGVPVPKVMGLPIEKALEILKEQGFDYQIDSVFVTDQQPGMVTQQDPDPGTNVKENRVIYLTMVTRMAPNVALPNLIGTQFISAESALSDYGLKVGDTTYQADTIHDRILEARFGGRAIRAGTMLPKGSKVDLVLGNGKGGTDVELPDLRNQDLRFDLEIVHPLDFGHHGRDFLSLGS